MALLAECPHGDGGRPHDGLHCGDDQHREGGGQRQALLHIQRLERAAVRPGGRHGVLGEQGEHIWVSGRHPPRAAPSPASGWDPGVCVEEALL